MYLPQDETPPIQLKPGQAQIRRQDFYSLEAKPNSETYIETDKCKGSNYCRTHADHLIPEDFLNREPPIKPKDTGGKNGSTRHWGSEYRNAHVDLHVQPFVRVREPPYFPYSPPSAVGPAQDPSSYSEDFGKKGTNPRDLVVPGHDKLPYRKSPLHTGTSKGTMHIPGYQGFLPQFPRSSCPESARSSSTPSTHRFSPRSLDKTNIQEVYHTNLVGYAGHVPQSARNDRGGRAPTQRTMHGKDYRDPHVFLGDRMTAELVERTDCPWRDVSTAVI